MRSKQINRLAKQHADRLMERGNAEFEAIKLELKRVMTADDARTIKALGENPSNDALYAALRPLADRAALGVRFENMWQLFLRVEKLNGE